jgi:signal transduction histidine kinase
MVGAVIDDKDTGQRGPWVALAGNPLRFLSSSWPWRSVAYLATAAGAGAMLWWLILPGLLFPPVLALLGLPVGALERWRLRLVGSRAADPHRRPAAPGLGSWLARRFGEAATWRELGYTACLATVLLFADATALFATSMCALLLALPLLVALVSSGVDLRFGGMTVETVGRAWAVTLLGAVPLTILTAYGVTVLAAGQAAFARWLLAPTTAETERKVAELTASRTRLVDAFEAERRRIERDLHDGAQQHLVLLSMNLGLAELELGADSPAGELVGGAQQQARQALAAMRELIHGIRPQVLTDFGLPAAVGELAERCRVAVDVDVRIDGRLPAQVESTAYFVVSEAVTNAVRHAGASRIMVLGRVVRDKLVVTVTDDGTGGADPALGTGLRGLVDRVAVLDGALTVASPLGGPTTVRMEVSCG